MEKEVTNLKEIQSINDKTHSKRITLSKKELDVAGFDIDKKLYVVSKRGKIVITQL